MCQSAGSENASGEIEDGCNYPEERLSKLPPLRVIGEGVQE
jgi:hypothetical protein